MLIASAGEGIKSAAHDKAEDARAGGAVIEIAFVNNMPSAAFDATEAKFSSLLQGAAAALGATVRLRRYALCGIDRTAEVRARLETDYEPVAAIYDATVDGLIVTGSEPLTADLRDEAYFDALAGLIAWAEEETASTVASCLAAHAAALIFDQIERETLPVKCSGVFVQEVRSDHALTCGLGPTVHMPHSRLNDLPGARMQEAGYSNLIESPELNWTVAV